MKHKKKIEKLFLRKERNLLCYEEFLSCMNEFTFKLNLESTMGFSTPERVFLSVNERLLSEELIYEKTC